MNSQTKPIKGFIIAVDSVIDVITNSSSELFIARTNKSVETVKEILLEILGYRNLNKSVDEQFADQYAFGDVTNVGENFELFLENYLANGNYYGYLNWGPLAQTFVGNIDELYWKVRNNGEFYKKDDDWQERHRLYNLEPEHPEQINYPKTEAYQRDKREEFIRNNSTPEVLEKLKGFVFIHSEGENTVPYELWDTINATFNGRNYHLG